jgi:hypothetical protein
LFFFESEVQNPSLVLLVKFSADKPPIANLPNVVAILKQNINLTSRTDKQPNVYSKNKLNNRQKRNCDIHETI